MRAYGNRSGDSGVVAYETGPDSIVVEFRGGARYLYDHTVPGATHVERMKALAEAGQGLAGYISREVGRRYARKLR